MTSFFHSCYTAVKLVIKNNYLISNQFLVLKIQFSNIQNFQNKKYDVTIGSDVIFQVTSGANDVIKCNVMVTFNWLITQEAMAPSLHD